MAETASLARPYVRAVFETAKADSNLADWSDQLSVLAQVVADPQIAELDAAAAGGYQTALSVRPGNPPAPEGHEHRVITSFADLL